MVDDVRQRIVKYLKMKSMSNRALASKLDMKETTLNSKLNGANKVDIELVCRILFAFPDLSAEWLLKGVGDAEDKMGASVQSDIEESLEAQNKRLLETIDNLNFMLRMLRGEKK